MNDLGKALQKLRDDALQAEIDSMKDGTEKRVAQIELDYQRRAEAINEAEQRIIELQGKLTQNKKSNSLYFDRKTTIAAKTSDTKRSQVHP